MAGPSAGRLSRIGLLAACAGLLGAAAVFRVYRVARYAKAAFPTRLVYGLTRRPELRLITCGGPFDDAAGSYLDNVVAFARLAAVRRA